MDYLSNNNLAYLSDDNIYQSTYGIIENNEIIDNDNDDKEEGKEKNFLTDVQIQNLLENYENNLNNNKNNKILFIFLFLFFFLIFCCFIF
jgi:hypothetical protein